MNWQIVSERLPEAVDRWRVAPRLFVLGYGWLMWDVAHWFMALPDPNAAQSAFVSTMTGVAAAIFGFYVNSGRKDVG